MTGSKRQGKNIITPDKKAIILIVLLSCMLACFLLLHNAKIKIYDMGFYKNEFAKVGTYERIDKATADNKTMLLLSFLKGREQLDDFFSDREKAHMDDVKNLVGDFTIAYYFFAVLLIGLLVASYIMSKKQRINYLNIIAYAFIGCLAVCIILALIFWLLSLNFSSSFVTFHGVFFSNDLWLLPEGSNLLILFPEKFFYDFALSVVYGTIISAFCLAAVGLVILRMKKSRFSA